MTSENIAIEEGTKVQQCTCTITKLTTTAVYYIQVQWDLCGDTVQL